MNLRTLVILAVSLVTMKHAVGMQIPVAKQNQIQSDQNQQLNQQQPFFTVAVLQPATGYLSLEDHVNQQLPTLKAAGYGLVPPKDWHLSVMIFAIPFPNQQPSAQYAQQALDTLSSLLSQKYKDDLTDITFEYKKLETLGNHKFLAAIYDRVGKKPFFRVYANIVRDFFNTYPDSWMFYGYGMLPHISVASKMKAAGPAVQTTIAGAPIKPVKLLNLRHKGQAYQRQLEISARWFDPNQKQWVELKSKPI